MLIKTLLENTAIPEDLGCEHGLSLYIEALGHKLLFDTGASGLFAENAQKNGGGLVRGGVSHYFPWSLRPRWRASSLFLS